MPSLSFTSLDRLIEPASSSPPSQAGPSFDRSKPFSFYPPLYATPPPQRPPSPSAFSPSPYVLNYKRRVPVHQPKTEGEESKAESLAESLSQQQCHRVDEEDVVVAPSDFAAMEEASLGDKGTPRKAYEYSTENEVFDMELEKRDASISRNVQRCIHSSGSLDLGVTDAIRAPQPGHSPVNHEEVEFFDATDSVFSESPNEDEASSIRSKPGRCLKGYTARTTTRLEEEMVRRMEAEENVASWERRWKMAKRCARLGVSVPSEIDIVSRSQSDSVAEVLDQELVVARLVAEAIARATARAEKEEELELVVGAKNREISRLWDKLQYLELVNMEMSQRNQEVTELSQRRWRRRQRTRKFALGGFFAAFCIGSVGLLCYKYTPWDETKSWTDMLLKSSPIDNESI